ncbi:MAG: hypothetical protein K1V87_06150 [Muribaculum sp.]
MLKHFIAIIGALLLSATVSIYAQTLDTDALKSFSPSTVREVFEICRYVKLTAPQQIKLAEAIDSENEEFVSLIAADNGVMSVKTRNRMRKLRDNALASILDQEQLAQYYRGVYDAEANAEGISIADRLQKKYDLTDQNWKFIRIAFYKIGLESRVIRKLMADTPKKAEAAIARLREEQLKTIEEKGGIRVNPDMTVVYIREFKPEALRKE